MDFSNQSCYESGEAIPVGQFWMPTGVIPDPHDLCFADVHEHSTTTNEKIASAAVVEASLTAGRGFQTLGTRNCRIFTGGGL